MCIFTLQPTIFIFNFLEKKIPNETILFNIIDLFFHIKLHEPKLNHK